MELEYPSFHHQGLPTCLGGGAGVDYSIGYIILV